MRAKKIAIPPELHQKIVSAFATCLGIREAVAEKSLEIFLADLLERLAAEPARLRELLSSGEEEMGVGLAMRGRSSG